MGRQTWKSNAEFLYSTIGYCVGLGNIWRFPYLCAESGAGAFLIPYFIMTIFLGVPLFYLEVGIGQALKSGPPEALAKLIPGMYGVGLATIMLTFLLSSYYCVVIAWSMVLVYSSAWTEQISDKISKSEEFINSFSKTDQSHELSDTGFISNHTQDSARTYWEIDILQNSRLEILICLIITWCLIYFTIHRGVSAASKISRVTVLVPYILLSVLMVQTLKLDGALDGVIYFLKPRWNQLLNFKVWTNAAAQVFNSLGIAFGSLITFGSFRSSGESAEESPERIDAGVNSENSSTSEVGGSNFNSDQALNQNAKKQSKLSGAILLRDSVLTVSINAITSIVAGVLIFSAIGAISNSTNISIGNLSKEGIDLLFVIYPKLFKLLGNENVWHITFFSVVMMLGFNTEFAMVQAIQISIEDFFKIDANSKTKSSLSLKRKIISGVVCTALFVSSLPTVTKFGIRYYKLMDSYTCILGLMLIAFLEVSGLCLFYGTNSLETLLIENKVVKKVPSFIKFCWKYVCPIVIFLILCITLSNLSVVTYKGESYGTMWHVFGITVSLLSVLCLPLGVKIVQGQTGLNFSQLWEIKDAKTVMGGDSNEKLDLKREYLSRSIDLSEV